MHITCAHTLTHVCLQLCPLSLGHAHTYSVSVTSHPTGSLSLAPMPGTLSPHLLSLVMLVVKTSCCPRVQMSQPLQLPHPARANTTVSRMGSRPSNPPIYPQLFPAVGDLMLQPLWESRDRYEELKRKDDATTAVSWGHAHLRPGRGYGSRGGWGGVCTALV